ncbi:hypothetical protein F7984_11645 [Pradoshia sp. D12]|uniref:helix-turn-helix domain-containing protein n=1 Tax=Bacillaceae TaxID=186817 RepID=UPI00080AFB8D|nr:MULTISPECIES: helix-turn-helix domain-containing protein [Bacillaceae]OCA83597.1 hypothetical protein A8L44_12265 [Bacillus sp. FJAT-27986]QFK71838.1 hypothetical protein F7984_11645 [Pradoshia sp. D12]TPF73633.1 hypothetical protein FHY44_08045 [Bacillus sp. D12]
MIIPYFDGLILYLINALKGQRTVYSPLHILNGKKSSQPIQDARLFNISRFFGVLPKLKRETWDQKIIELTKKGYIKETGINTYVCTQHGKQALSFWEKDYPQLTNLDGRTFQDAAHGFWMRLQLLVQTSSCLLNGNHSFIAVSRNQEEQLLVKKLFKKIPLSSMELAQLLYQELDDLLSNVNEAGAELIVSAFSGHQHAGLTIEQAARKLNIDVFYARLLFWDTIHYMLKASVQSPYILLKELVLIGKPVQSLLTASTQRTLKMLQAGMSKEEVAAVRNLKTNTIEDHLVEIVSNVPDFPIDDFVSATEKEQIKQAIATNETKQLRSLKMVLPSEITYFKIRLVMATIKEV